MLHRQRVVLELLGACGGACELERLVDLVFLLAHARRESGFYEFVRLERRPFSFGLEHDLSKLEQLGFVERERDQIKVTSKPDRPPTKPEDVAQVVAVVSATAAQPTGELAAEIRAMDPWYVAPEGRSARPELAPRPAELAVYTAGYEGLQVDGFLDLLLRGGVENVVDVRADPIARRFGFHGSTLRRLCGRVGLNYEHHPELGIEGSIRHSTPDREALFDFYRSKILPDRGDALDGLARVFLERPSVLVCSEASPKDCHRSRLAEVVARRTGLEVKHFERESTASR